MQNSVLVQQKLAEREQLLSTLDQAQMQEALNKAMQTLTSTIGDDVPTFEEVRKKIDRRLARAQSIAELHGAQINSAMDARMLEVEQAQIDAVAQDRLAEIHTSARPPAASAGVGRGWGARHGARCPRDSVSPLARTIPSLFRAAVDDVPAQALAAHRRRRAHVRRVLDGSRAHVARVCVRARDRPRRPGPRHAPQHRRLPPGLVRPDGGRARSRCRSTPRAPSPRSRVRRRRCARRCVVTTRRVDDCARSRRFGAPDDPDGSRPGGRRRVRRRGDDPHLGHHRPVEARDADAPRLRDGGRGLPVLDAASPRDDRLMTSLPLFHINAPAYSTLGSIARARASRSCPASRRAASSTTPAGSARPSSTRSGRCSRSSCANPSAPDDVDNPLRLCYTGPSPERERQLEIEARFGIEIVCGYALSERPDRSPLRPSRRRPRVRPAGERRAAVRVSRLAVRCHRAVPGNAGRTRGLEDVPGHQTAVLSRGGEERHSLGLPRRRHSARVSGARLLRRAGQPHLRVQGPHQLQLAAGAGSRHRSFACVVPASLLRGRGYVWRVRQAVSRRIRRVRHADDEDPARIRPADHQCRAHRIRNAADCTARDRRGAHPCARHQPALPARFRHPDVDGDDDHAMACARR